MKCVRSIAVLCIVSILLVAPSFAWDSESFIGRDYSVYSVHRDVSLLSPSASSDSSSGPMMASQFVDLLSSTSSFYFGVSVHHDSVTVGGITVPAYDEFRYYPDSGISFTGSYHGGSAPAWEGFRFGSSVTAVSVPSSLNGGSSELVYFPFYNIIASPNPVIGTNWSPGPVDVSVDISSLGSFSAFSLSGVVRIASDTYVTGYSSSRIDTFGGTLSVLVDGRVVKTYSSSGDIDFADFIYSQSTPISSLVFRVEPNYTSVSYIDGGVYTSFSYLFFKSSGFSFSVLSDWAYNDAVNDEGQDAINDEDALQSEWGGSMVENFNSLNVGSFSYPAPLLSAFSLVSGIFQDVWYAFGDYAILWVFPLTLAILLLVIGRLSKFAGRSSKDGGG